MAAKVFLVLMWTALGTAHDAHIPVRDEDACHRLGEQIVAAMPPGAHYACRVDL